MKKLMKLMTMLTLVLLVVGAVHAETIKVMTFNIWVGGGDSLQQTINEIQNSGADIIGMQEASGGSFETIAAAIGFYSDTNTWTLSRWPITAVQGYGYGQAVTICTPTGNEVYMFNCHLTAYPYAPYDLPDTRKALHNEGKTQWPDLEPILINMAPYIATGQPVFLTGDFNAASHLDYADVAWRCSTECANAGLVDSYWYLNGSPGGHTWPPDWDYYDYGITWTPKPEEEPNDKFDRIDFVYNAGTGVFAAASTELDGPLWPSDHRAVVTTFTSPDGPGGDCVSCTATDMHIEAVVCAELGGCATAPASSANGKATVTIYDDCGDPVADALVDATFSGDFNESFDNVVTDSNGQAVFTTSGCIKNPSFSFTVDDVTGPLPYDSGDDLTTGCSG